MSTLNGPETDVERISRHLSVGLADPIVYDAGQRRNILVVVCVALMAVITAVTGLNALKAKCCG